MDGLLGAKALRYVAVRPYSQGAIGRVEPRHSLSRHWPANGQAIIEALHCSALCVDPAYLKSGL